MEQAWTHILEELTQQIGKKEQPMDPPLVECVSPLVLTLLRCFCFVVI